MVDDKSPQEVFAYLNDLDFFNWKPHGDKVATGLIFETIFFSIIPQELQSRLVKGVIKELMEGKEGKGGIQVDYILLKRLQKKITYKQISGFPLKFCKVDVEDVAAIIEIKSGEWYGVEKVKKRIDDIRKICKQIPIYFIFFGGTEPKHSTKRSHWAKPENKQYQENTFYLKWWEGQEGKEERKKRFTEEYNSLIKALKNDNKA